MTAKRRPGPVRGTDRALPEGARAARDSEPCAGGSRVPGPPASPAAGERCRSGPRPSGPVHPRLPPSPCSPRNGHGAAGASRFLAPRAFAQRWGAGGGRHLRVHRQGSQGRASLQNPRIPALPDLPVPPLRGRRAFPQRRTPVGRRQGRGRSARARGEPSRRGWVPSALARCAGAETAAPNAFGLEAPGADLGGIL